MWKILGVDSIYLDISYTFKKKIIELAVDDETGTKFKQLMDKSEVSFMINGETEENCFIIQVPDEYSPEEIEFMADQIMKEIIENDVPPVMVGKVEQKYKIIINNSHEPEIIGLRKTPGMSSAEVFKPIFGSWSSPGKANPHTSGGFQL